MIMSKFSELKDFSFETTKIVIVSLLVILGIRSYVMQPFFVSGKSMEPNFYDGDSLLVDEISYKFGNPERGDVVIFRYPRNPKEYFIKRVIGLPGEKVEVKDGKITVYNGEYPEGFRLDENIYLPSGTITSGNYTFELKNDEYFVLGDNRGASADSRLWGALEKHYIVGRAWIRAWPLNEFSIFKPENYATER